MRYLILSLLLVLLSACGGGEDGGSCIRTTTGTTQVCYNGWTAEECIDGQHSQNSCQDNGFTKNCPSEGSNTFRLPSYSC